MEPRPTTARYTILAWLTVLAALSYLCRNAVGVAESTIREAMHLSLDESGWFMSAFFWTYAICQVPSGAFAQRYGTRIPLTIFAVVWSLASAGFGLAPELSSLIAAQLVMGFAQAGIFPAACNSIGHWMPFSQRSMACGVLSAGMQVGAILAGILAGELLKYLSWRLVFLIFSVPGIVCAIVFLIQFRDQPEQSPAVNEQELDLIRAGREPDHPAESGTTHSEESWRMIVSNPALWLICGQQICRAGAYLFFASWFPTFLQETRGLSIKSSGYSQGFVLTGTLTGSLMGGVVVDYVWQKTKNLRLSRSAVGAAACGMCGLLILASWFFQSPTVVVVLLALGSFFAAVAGPCAYSATIDIGGNRVPQVFGMMNMCGNIAAGVCPIVVGKIFKWTSNWDLVLLLFAGVYFTGALCWAFVNPQRSLRIRDSAAVP